MAEEITLTTPITQPSITGYKVERLDLNWRDSYIHGELIDNNGKRFEPEDYRGQIAKDLVIALNKANLSIKSLHRRYLERLVADGKLNGTISGTPD